MRKFIVPLCFFAGMGSYALASAAVTAATSGTCAAPVANTNVTVGLGGGDRFTVALANPLASSSITPNNTNPIYSLTPSGTVCRFTASVATGTFALNSAFTGMTFANPSLAIRNTNADTTGEGVVGTAANTTQFTIGALASDLLTVTTGTAIAIKRRATGATNFGFATTPTITLTAYPTNEGALAASANPFVTITVTLTQVAG